MTILETATVADVASRLPSSVRVFERYGIDFSCRGRILLRDACRKHGVPYAELVAAIEASTLTPTLDPRDWTAEPLHLLVDHLIETYHEPLREELARLESMAEQLARVHGHKAVHFAQLYVVVSELAADLRSHMRKEERVLFPAIRVLATGPARFNFPIGSPISIMEHEHEHAGALLAELRAITDGYVAPVRACDTCRALYRGLSELETAMHLHVHLENNILFPRALALSPAVA